MTAPQPKPPKPQYSFTSFQVNNPTAPPPGDKLDSEYAQTAKVISDVIAWVGTSLNSDGSLKAQPKSADPTPIAGADGTALASDYATLAGAWAEHMPDTIPPNILAFADVTGDHWSSRWWANYASQAIQNWQNALPPAPTNTARYVYVATAGQTVFTGPDRNAATLAFDPLIPQRTQVFRRGLLLTPTDDYNETVANRITLTLPAAIGDIVQVFVFTLPQAFTQPPFTNSGSFTPPTGANYTLLVQASGGATITLGSGRVIGQLITIKDALGAAGASPITVQAAATIDNNPTYRLMSDFASVTLLWLGTMWGTV